MAHQGARVHLGDAEFARFRYPEIMKLVDNSDLFAPVATLYGLDHVQTRYIWRWTGKEAALSSADSP